MSKKAKKRKREAERLGLGEQYWYDLGCLCCPPEPVRAAVAHSTIGGRGTVGQLVDRDKTRRRKPGSP